MVLKLLRPDAASDLQRRAAFQEEGRLGRSVRHPNTVSVRGYSEIAGNPVVVREYVEGTALQDAIVRAAAGKLETLRAPELGVAIVLRVLAGLAAAHGTSGDDGLPLGIVHGSLSPRHVLLSRFGEIKVAGLASTGGGVEPAGPAGVLLARLGYVAPEQLRGTMPDERTDVYLAGIVLWETLTAHRALPDTVSLRADDRLIDRPHKYNSAVSRELDMVVMKALAPRPADRFHSAIAFSRELLRALPSARNVDAATVADTVAAVMGTYRETGTQ